MVFFATFGRIINLFNIGIKTISLKNYFFSFFFFFKPEFGNQEIRLCA